MVDQSSHDSHPAGSPYEGMQCVDQKVYYVVGQAPGWSQ